MRRIFFPLICVTLFLVKVANAEKVKIATAKNQDFARIVFQWVRPVGHSFIVQDRGFKIRFSRKIEAPFQLPVRRLPGYIASVKPEAGGLGIEFLLTSDFDTYSYESGTSIIVEIEGSPVRLPKTDSKKKRPLAKRGDVNAMDPPSSNPPKPSNKNKEIVLSRFAEHPKYTRIVFDWSSKIKYSLEQKEGGVFIEFGKVVGLDVKKLRKTPPRLVGDVLTTNTARSSLVAIAIPKTSKIRHFLSGTKVVVDILQPTGSELVENLPQNILPDSNVLAKAKEEENKDEIEKKQSSEDPKADLKTKALSLSKPSQKDIDRKKTQIPPKEKNQVPSENKEQSNGKTADREVDKPKLDSEMAPQTLVSSKVAADRKAESGEIKDAKISISKIEGVNGGMALRFDWVKPVGAAIFRRTGALWIAFDERSRVDTNKILGVIPLPEGADPENPPPPPDPENAPPPKPSLQDLVKSVDQLVATSGTVLRMKTKKGVNPTLSRDGNSWVLTFSRRQLKPNNLIEVKAQPKSPEGPRIFLPIQKAGKPLGVTDPETGSNMIIVPVIPLSHGVARDFFYPEVMVLKTGQGALIVPVIDSLKVQSNTKGIIVQSSVAMNISDVSGELLAAVKESVPGELTSELDLEQWSTPQGTEFRNRKEKLFRSITTAKKPSELSKARLDLARFYFGNGYAPEAISVLEMLEMEDPKAANTPEVSLLRAGSSFLLGRYNESARFLKGSELDKIDEAAFWRAATISKSGKMVAGAYEMQRTGELIKTYPKPLRIPLSLLVADAAVTIGQLKPAKDMLKSLNKLEPSQKEKSEIFYLEGKLAEADGKRESAIEKWEEALSIGHRPIFVRASAARIENLLRLEKISVAEATRELEKLRFLWRGDDFEFELLRRLGNLYLNQKGYRRGLKTLRQVVTHFSNHKDVNSITEEMTDTFNFLFLKDGADELPPIAAIALFQDFQELTPAGRQGDEMIRKLADRLVAVDLLSQASGLLNEQVQNRLEGQERGEVGLYLAIIHAFDKKYQKMVNVLNQTNVADLPEAIKTRRRHLRAHALGNLDRQKEALLLLKGDKTVDADLVRAEMFWNNRDWADASQSLLSAIRSEGIKIGQKLNDGQALMVLNLATAYTLSNNQKALARLRKDYGEAMVPTFFNDAFQLIAAPDSLGLINPDSVSKRVEMVTNFRSFLQKYKTQVKDRKLSSISRVGKIVGRTKAI